MIGDCEVDLSLGDKGDLGESLHVVFEGPEGQALV